MTLHRLEARRRQAARIALYGSLVMVGPFTGRIAKLPDPPLRARQTEEWIRRDYASLPEVKLLQQYAPIDTSESTGDELKGAEFLARHFAAAGIPYRIEKVGPRKANLYAWLVGRDSHPLVLHNHIDVSDVDPKEWFSPPFEARIRLPWIYGRGVFDMKSVAIAQMLAMIDLKKSGVPLSHSVLFLATSSEERGSRLGVRRLIQLHPELVRSSWAVPVRVREAPGGGWELEIKFQLLPGEDLESAREKLVPGWLTFGLTTMVDDPHSARAGSPLDNRVYKTIETTLREAYPDAPVGPYFLPWTATDVCFFRTLGVLTYGFSPFLIMNTDTLQVDQANERFAVPAFADGVELYKKLVRRLVSDT